jgi:hypothetical protein
MIRRIAGFEFESFQRRMKGLAIAFSTTPSLLQ